MKSFQAIIIAAIFAAATAANEPVASPAAANIERELAEYEKRHLQQQGTPATSPPTPSSPTRPPESMSYYSYGSSKSGKGSKSGSKGGKSNSYSYSTSMSYGGGKGGKSGSKGGKSDGSYSFSASMNSAIVGAKATKRQ